MEAAFDGYLGGTQLRARAMALSLSWTPRDQNAEADALADGQVDSFDPAQRVGGRAGDIPWLILPGLLRTGEAFYKAAGKRPRADDFPKAGKKLAGQRLKDREPW